MDSRFDTSNWSSQDSQAGPSSKPFPSDQQDDFQQELEEQSDQDELDFDQEEEEGRTARLPVQAGWRRWQLERPTGHAILIRLQSRLELSPFTEPQQRAESARWLSRPGHLA